MLRTLRTLLVAAAATALLSGGPAVLAEEEVQTKDMNDFLCKDLMRYAGEDLLSTDYQNLRAKRGDYDVVQTMYHDQGQIAMKLMGFELGVTLIGGTDSNGLLPSSTLHGIDDSYTSYWTGLESNWMHDGWNCLNWASSSTDEINRCRRFMGASFVRSPNAPNPTPRGIGLGHGSELPPSAGDFEVGTGGERPAEGTRRSTTPDVSRSTMPSFQATIFGRPTATPSTEMPMFSACRAS